ncbi:O-methyltransferase [Cognatitamlana onchidii]|uniref:O-methyltransferase n=1 Tax=Cognatitamlana onchidii TaxID=2562860 RepID=UPI0010A6197B|nr:class I SAM-dependent methyltransferase [Algibacter onchidii]
MMYQVRQYLRFLVKSKNQHGVHSPFVFDLVTKCFYDKTKYSKYAAILNYKKTLKAHKEAIEVTDLGAGSHIMKTKTRQISDISKNAGTTNKRAKLLYRLTKYLNSEHILELGTSLGIATHAMSLGNPDAKISSIEGCPNTATFAEGYLNTFNVQNCHIIKGDFKSILKTLPQKTYNLVFFDGNHQKEATLYYFHTLLENANNDSVFIFDDIYWSKEMTEAWETIKNHAKVTVTVDTFFWGIVFFRQEQAKEHFRIRV